VTSNRCPRASGRPRPAGPAALAAEVLGRVRAELPVVGGLGEPDQVLVSAWLTGLRSARPRRAYAGDAAAWLGWLGERGTDMLAAGRAEPRAVEEGGARVQIDSDAGHRIWCISSTRAAPATGAPVITSHIRQSLNVRALLPSA
jgi:hypothetical protein